MSVAMAKPGDVLIVGLNKAISDGEFEILRERFQDLIDMGIKVFLVDNCSALTVVRPGVNDGSRPAA